jgi:hypothetical protein
MRVFSLTFLRVVPLCAALAAIACGATDGPDDLPPGDDPPAGDEPDLPLGDVSADDLKADSAGWGAALTCKPVPDLPRLDAPRIVVSLNGLTLRLVDTATGFEKVFPVGVGAHDTDSTSVTYGESLSYYPVIARGRGEFEIRPTTIQPCKVWWRDGATGQRLPVFAGLPFLSWSGNYAIHGPVDDFRAPNGGSLRRGFVSHGCVRMAAADVLEVYARIRGVARVPVRIQREPERDARGRRIDVTPPWFGAECLADAECASIPEGVCASNPYTGRGFCSARCTRYCPDRAGQPTSFCVADPDAPSRGLCVPRETPQNAGCRNADHLRPASRPRFGSPSVRATVCLPGSPGWIGDRCFTDAECTGGTQCAGETTPGTCTQSCARACPDQPGWPWTFCADDDVAGAADGGSCLRRCTPAANASECPPDTACVPRARAGDPAVTRDVCAAD